MGMGNFQPPNKFRRTPLCDGFPLSLQTDPCVVAALEDVDERGGPEQYTVIGNELAGDTELTCDYLDPGDGTEIQAAINAEIAAGRTPAIALRQGTYTLTTPLVVSSGDLYLVGSGKDSCTLVNLSGGVLHFTAEGATRNLYLADLRLSAINIGGAIILAEDTFAPVLVRVSWDGAGTFLRSYGEMIDIHLEGVHSLALNTGIIHAEDGVGVTQNVANVLIDNCLIANGLAGSAFLECYRLVDARIVNSVLSTSGQFIRNSEHMNKCGIANCRITAPEGLLVSPTDQNYEENTITGCHLDAPIVSTSVWMVRNVITGNVFVHTASSPLDLSAGGDDNLIIGNYFEDGGFAIKIAGTGNMVTNNRVPVLAVVDTGVGNLVVDNL